MSLHVGQCVHLQPNECAIACGVLKVDQTGVNLVVNWFSEWSLSQTFNNCPSIAKFFALMVCYITFLYLGHAGFYCSQLEC